MTALFRKSAFFPIGVLCLCVEVAAAGAIRINGVEQELEKNIRAYLTLAKESCDAEKWRVRRRFKTASPQIREALEPFGHYDVRIEKRLTWADDCWQANFDIDPGKAVVLRDVNLALTGAARDDPAFADVFTSAGLSSGQPLRHAEYTRVKQRIESLAADRGYFDGRFLAARIDIWPSELAADVTLSFESGERYRIGEIRLVQDFLEPELVQRYITIRPGEPYSSASLSSMRKSLHASGYFSEVSLRPDTQINSARVVPLAITLVPVRRLAYTLGGGYSTDVGPRIRAGFENRRLNSKGHRFDSDLEISKVVKEISATYSLPLGDPKVEWFSASTGFQAEDTDTSESDQTSFGIRRAVKQSADWIRTDGLSLQFDNFTVGTDSDRSRLLIPSVGFSQKRANRPINPERGHRLSAELKGASDALFSTTDFLQLTLSAKIIRPLGEGGLVSARIDAGATVKEQFSELPPSIRFFAGGTESVRGYAYESLGATDENGLVIGGSNLLTGSIEYEKRFYNDFSYALFVDAGNAFEDGDIDARIGAGIGLKWRSPIGPFRVYLAHPVNYSDRSVRLHISIGPDL